MWWFIPEERLVRPCREEEIVDVVEVGEICVDFQDPVWPAEDHGYDIDEGDFSRQERPVLHPGNDVVKTPGDVEADRCGGEVPAVDGVVAEDEGAMAHGED